MNSARLLRGAVAAVLVTVLLSACSSDGEDGVPRSWIGKTYSVGGSGWLDKNSSPVKVADAIDGHRDALDRASGGGSEFLRYGDDMVTVSPYSSGGSSIEIEDYRNGYRRHHQHLTYWPNPSSFRGGGPGSGK